MKDLAATRKVNGESRDLPKGMMLVESFDLVRGGMEYSVTGPKAPNRCAFKYFKSREEAIANAMEGYEE